MDIRVKLDDAAISSLREKNEDIKRSQLAYREAVIAERKGRGLTTPILGYLSYDKQVRNPERNMFDRDKPIWVMKSFVRLAYIHKWALIGDEFVAKFCSVGKDGSLSDCIEMMFCENIDFQSADCSLEDARKKLKEIKKELKNA